MLSRSALALLLAVLLPATVQAAAAPPPPLLTPEQILKKVTYPAEFDATVFASPPDVSYPIFLSAAPDGTLFVGSDGNGSLDRKPDRGSVIMCRDTNGDGKADVFTTFAKMDSPRGVAWDPSTRTLYVMHPPNLTAYHDDNNTGTANREEDLITGLGFGLDFRGADHTTNGIRLGIDGWLYIAVGDYGAVKAAGRDGRSLALRGGGIVRVRPDGSGMELVAHGLRNILAVAISPTLDLFTRDNTNDGDDWNVRLSAVPFGAEMGYPNLFRNFADEIIPPLIDFGGGSPVGSIFIDEPALPAEWAHGFYTVEWGKSEIAQHPLTPSGAGWKVETKPFAKMTRATDLEVDGAGNLYASSWEGASFTYVGPNVGYIIRLSPKERKRIEVPDFKKLTAPQLVEQVGGGSAVWRLAAQRELLTRPAQPESAEGLERIARTSSNPGAQVAAIFTLKQWQGAASHPALVRLLDRDDLREYALKALADDVTLTGEIAAGPFLTALDDKNPRVRLQAVTALGRLGKTEAGAALLRRTADTDATVAHVAVQALRWLRASGAAFAALDAPDESLHRGALRVLQSLHEPVVAEGLLQRLATPNRRLRQAIYATLARLDTREAPYTDPKMWWGTRPDTSGPIYKPERWTASDTIEAALKTNLEKATGEEAKAFVIALMRMKVSFPGFSELMLAKVGDDTAARLDVIAPLLSPRAPAAPELLGALKTIATNSDEKVDLRARAFRLLAGQVEKNADAAADALGLLAEGTQPPELAAIWEEFTRDTRLARSANVYAGLARAPEAGKRLLGATILVNLATSPILKDERAKRTATTAVESLWKNPEQAATLLTVIGRLHATSYAPQVRENLSNPSAEVAAAAKTALAQLGLEAPETAPQKTIGEIPFEEVVRMVASLPGDASKGRDVFMQRACFVCHTVAASEPPKGPMLSGIAQRYTRAEVCEAILLPNAKIAQGFESQYFKLRNASEVEGFVVKEGGDSVEVRNLVGITTVIEKGDIVSREKRERSIMPEGLLSSSTPQELASLLAYLESTSGK